MKLSPSVLKALPVDASPEEFEKRCLANRDLFEHFAKVMKRKFEANQADQLKVSRYESPSWAYQQSDSIGYQRALDEAMKLMIFKD